MIVSVWNSHAECTVRFGPFATDKLVDHFLDKLDRHDQYRDARVEYVNQPILLGTNDVLVDEVYG